MRRFAFAVVLAAASIHCGGSSDRAASEDVGTAAEPLLTHCYAEIERPSPTAATLPIGTALTLRTNPNLVCPDDVTERLVYRFYVEGPSGVVYSTPAGTWSTSRLVPIDTSAFAPGRYRIYAYSLPATMVTAWAANDATARATAHRSGYTYVTFVGALPDTLFTGGQSHALVLDPRWDDDPESGLPVVWVYEPSGWTVALWFPTIPTTPGDYALYPDNYDIPDGDVCMALSPDGSTPATVSSGTFRVVSENGALHATFAGTLSGGASIAFDFTLPE